MFYNGLSYVGKMMVVPLDERRECLAKIQAVEQRAMQFFPCGPSNALGEAQGETS